MMAKLRACTDARSRKKSVQHPAVEHQDKGRLVLNFVIPNMELQTGKRLQPVIITASRPRIDAWQTLVNHHYGLHDPNAPENRRTLTLPDNLPETKQALAESVIRGIDALYHAGEIKDVRMQFRRSQRRGLKWSG